MPRHLAVDAMDGHQARTPVFQQGRIWQIFRRRPANGFERAGRSPATRTAGFPCASRRVRRASGCGRSTARPRNKRQRPRVLEAKVAAVQIASPGAVRGVCRDLHRVDPTEVVDAHDAHAGHGSDGPAAEDRQAVEAARCRRGVCGVIKAGRSHEGAEVETSTGGNESNGAACRSPLRYDRHRVIAATGLTVSVVSRGWSA